MQTNELIEELASDLQPTPSRARRLATAVIAGAAAALVLVWSLFGFRADLSVAMLTAPFWMKWAFALVTAAIAFVLCARLARPESKPGWWPVALTVPLFVLAIFACIELVNAPPAERQMLWMGSSAFQCFWCIPALAAPFLLGALWAFRRFAPTHLRLAGFSAGVLSGAAAAAVYALHCDEVAPAFVATWYSAGMLLPGVLGLTLGPRLLRW